MKQSISMFGLGYVGSVMAACLAATGHRIIGVDVNRAKVDALDAGQSPILENAVAQLAASAHKRGDLTATHDAIRAVAETDVSIICVGTPSYPNGTLDLRAVTAVCEQIGSAMREKQAFHRVVLRSTVLPGTTEEVVLPVLERTSRMRLQNRDFGLCVNPEFLREGSAVADFMTPALTVIGSAFAEDASWLADLYSFTNAPVYKTTLATAEMIKYACNSYHALKVAFTNEVATIGHALGVDVPRVMEIFCADHKLNISAAYLRPGFAFGGSCLPKDLRALAHLAREMDIETPVLQSILPSNQQHVDRAVDAVLSTGKRRVALLGISFKAGTDDLRESPYVQVAKRLIGEGIQLRIWDKSVSLGMLLGANRQYIMQTLPHIGSLLCDSIDETVEWADVVVIGTARAISSPLPLRLNQIVIDLNDLKQQQCKAEVAETVQSLAQS